MAKPPGGVLQTVSDLTDATIVTVPPMLPSDANVAASDASKPGVALGAVAATGPAERRQAGKPGSGAISVRSSLSKVSQLIVLFAKTPEYLTLAFPLFLKVS